MPRSSPLLRWSRFEHIVVPVLYTLIALLTSYPLVAQFGDHIAGVDGDVWSYLWALGWARVALLNLGVNPFHNAFVFYPLGGATQLLWGTALPGFASIPLQLAFGLVPAFNLMYLGASVLTAYGMYWLGKEILTNDERRKPNSLVLCLASFVMGLAFAFGALRLGYGIAFTNLFHTEFIPFYVLFLLRATWYRSHKNAVLAGFFFALNAYIDFQIAAFLALLTALWFLYVLLRAGAQQMKNFAAVRDALQVRGKGVANLAGQWAIMSCVAGVLVLPMLAFVLDDFSIEGGNYIRVYPLRYSAERSYDALSFVIPNARSALYQNFAPRLEGVNASVNVEGDSELSPDRQSFLGVAVLVLAALGALSLVRARWFWLVLIFVFGILSLGPVLHVAGVNSTLPLPFALANAVPILNNIRIPMRYGLFVFFGVSILAGAGSLKLFARANWHVVPVSFFILLEAIIFPYPTLEFRPSPVYEQMAQTPGDFTVLEIPSFNWRLAAKNEAYQAIHQKRILRAYTNRIAPDLADYFNLRQTPLVVRSLRILEGEEQGILTDAEIAQDRAALDDTLRFFNLRYTVLHRDQLDAQRASEVDAYVRDVMGGRMFYSDDAVSAYTFSRASTPPQARTLDLADNASLMYLGRGWQIEPLADAGGARGRYLKNASSEMILPRAQSLTLRVLNENARADLKFFWNGNPLDARTIENGWQTIELRVPPDLEQNNLNHFQIQQAAREKSIAVGSLELR